MSCVGWCVMDALTAATRKVVGEWKQQHTPFSLSRRLPAACLLLWVQRRMPRAQAALWNDRAEA